MLFRIVLPLSGPALATLAVLTFLWTWNDFLWPLIATVDRHDACSWGWPTFQGAHYTNWPLLMAGNVMALPVLLVFVIAQKWFVQSLAASGLKG